MLLGVLYQIPGASLYMVAWQKQGSYHTIPPLLVDVCMGLRPLYVVIVPLLHGSVMDRTQPHSQYQLTFSRYCVVYCTVNKVDTSTVCLCHG